MSSSEACDDECCISLVLAYLIDYCFAHFMLVMMYIARNKFLYWRLYSSQLAAKQCSSHLFYVHTTVPLFKFKSSPVFGYACHLRIDVIRLRIILIGLRPEFILLFAESLWRLALEFVYNL